MQDKSSSAEPTGVLWHRTRIWWPVERVPVLLQIVHPRTLTALEWAVLKVMEVFSDGAPSLEEVAEELGIAEPMFLLDTVREVVRLRALTPRDGASWSDLPDLIFTPTGRELFQRGKIEGDPAEHGVELYFDALTDEARLEPTGWKERTDSPFPVTTARPEPRSAVGLDRVREIVRRFHRDLLRGGGEVRDVETRAEPGPSLVWSPVDVDIRLSDEGALSLYSPAFSDAALQVLQSCDLCAEGVVPCNAMTGEWPPSETEHKRTGQAYSDWRRLTSRTLPHRETEHEALRLLETAREEVLLHCAWFEHPKIKTRIDDLVRAGVRVGVLSSPDTMVVQFSERPRPGFLVTLGGRRALPSAMLVDRESGLLCDDVDLSIGDVGVRVELAGVLTAVGREHVRTQFLHAVAEALPLVSPSSMPVACTLEGVEDDETTATAALEDPAVRLALTRLGLLGSKDDLPACVTLVAALTPGPSRVAALNRLGSMAKALVPEMTEDEGLSHALGAWRELASQLAEKRGEQRHLDLLARLAPVGVAADELVAAALAGIAPPAEDLMAAGAFLLDLREAVDGRWGREACRHVEAFVHFRDRVLNPGGPRRLTLGDRLGVAKRLLDAPEIEQWATAELASWDPPAEHHELAAWVEAALPLVDVAPDAVRRHVERHLRRLLQARPAEAVELVAAARLLPARTLLDALLPSDPLFSDLLSARRTILAARLEMDSSALRTLAEKILPSPAVLPSSPVITEAVRSFEELGGDEAQLALAGRAWASRVASALPVPETAYGLPWWFSELSVLRSLLDDLPSRASAQLQRFRGVLRSSRARSEPLWDDVRRAWVELGLAESVLTDLTAEPAIPSNTGGKKKKGRKRR